MIAIFRGRSIADDIDNRSGVIPTHVLITRTDEREATENDFHDVNIFNIERDGVSEREKE